MSEPQKTVFKKLELDSSKLKEDHKNNLMNGEEFENKFVFSMDAKKNQSRMRNVLLDNLKDRYRVEKPKKSVIGQWTEKYNRWTYKNKQLGYFAKKDLDDHAKKQIDIQRHLYVEQSTYNKRKQEEREYLKQSVLKDEVPYLEERFKTEEEQEALSHWMVAEGQMKYGEGIGQRDYFNGLANETPRFYVLEMKKIIEHLPKMIRAEDFSFKNDKEFVSQYAKKYDLLCKGASAEVFVKKLEALIAADEIDTEVSLIEAKAVVSLCKELKTEYEERLMMIQSPYYAMTTAKDLDRYLGDDWEEKLKEDIKEGNPDFVDYVARYRKLKTSAFGKGKNLNSLYREKLQQIQQETRDRDVEKVRALQIQEQDTAENTMEAYYQKHLEDAKKAWANKDDREFLTKTEISFGHKAKDLEPKDYHQFEQMLLEIKYEGKLHGVPVKKEHQELIVKELDQLVALRRETYAKTNASMRTDTVQSGNFADMKNPAFLETEEGKFLQKLQGCDWIPKTEETQESLNTYLDGVFSLMEKIVNMGYAVVPEYEGRLNQSKYMDQGLERARKEYEKVNNKKTSVQGKAKRIEFPEVSVNGKKYKTYGMMGFMTDMEGADLNAGEEAEKLFRELSDVYRKKAVAYGLYNLEDGMKSFVGQVYEKKYAAEATALENQLMVLLYDKNWKVRLYLRSHPELKARKELLGLYEKIKKQAKEKPAQELMDLAILNAKSLKEEESRKAGYKEKEINEAKMKSYVEELKKLNENSVQGETVLDFMKNMTKNMDVCRRVRELRHEISRGLSKGFKVDDETLLSLRTKFMFFEMVKKTTLLIQQEILQKDEAGKRTEEQWEKVLAGDTNEELFAGIPALLPGKKKEFLEAVSKKFTDEYNDRENSIKDTMKFYSRNGKISSGELKKRKDAYCKNALISEYISVNRREATCEESASIIRAWCKENGRTEKLLTRTESNYLIGKSPEEVIRLYRMFTGTIEEQFEAYQEYYQELQSFKLDDFKYTGEAGMLDNFRRKQRLAQLHANAKDFGDKYKTLLEKGLKLSPEEEKETEEKVRKADILENYGCAYEADRITAIIQIRQSKHRNALSFEDFANLDEKMVQKISQVDLDEFISVTGKELTLTEQEDLESFLGNRARFICVPLRTRPLTKEQVAANKQAKKKGKPPVYLQKRGAFKVAPTVLYKAEEEYYDKEEAAARKEELKKAKERGAKKDLKKEEKTGEKTTGKKEQKQEKKTGQKQEQKKEEKKTEEKAEEKKEEKKIIERAEAQPNVPQADHRIYTEEEFIRRSEALKAFHIDQAPQTYAEMEELVIRHKTWTIKDGKDYLAWKKNLSPELIAHLEWLQGYYHYLDVGKEIPRLAPGNYHANLGMVLPYEEQETNNCFACSGTAMLNQFIAKKKGQSQITKIYDQFAMRSFQPKIRLQDPKDEGFVSKESYNHQVQEINQYAGEGKTKTGNVFALGDFILEKLEEQGITDCMLNRMTLHVPTTADGTDTELDKKNKETKYHNMKEIFARQIADIIAKGGVASVLETFGDYGHYLTVTGINEKQELEFYNSSSGKLETKSVDEFIHRGYLYEINWISDKKTPEELTGEFKNLSYDPQTGYELKKMDPTSYHESISHTKGITVNKQLEEENPAYKDVALTVYIPDSKKEVLSKPLFDYRADEGLLTAEEKKTKTKEKTKENTKEKKQEETKQEKKQEEKKQEETKQEKKQEEKNKRRRRPVWKLGQAELEEIKKKEQENYNKLNSQISEWEKEIDKDTSGKYNTDNRTSKATVNFIAWLERDKKEEEKSDYKELYRGFRYVHDGTGMTKEEKKQKILTLKKLFNAIMSFDIRGLKFEKPEELSSEKHFDNRMFMKFTFDTQLIVNGFAEMMKDPEAQEMLKEKDSDTAFTEEEYLKTKCRMDFFMGANAVLQAYPNVFVNAQKAGLDPDELMELGLEGLRDKLKKTMKDKDMAKIEVYSNAINLVTALTKNGGYEIDDPMESYRNFLEDSLTQGRIAEYPEEDAQLVSKKAFTDAVGEDTVEKELTEAMKKQKEDFFKERYDKTLPGDEALDKKVADTLKASFGVTKVSSMTTRRKQAKEKIVLQQRLLAEQEKFLKTREADKRKVRTISEGQFANINRSFYDSEEALASLREMMDNRLNTVALLAVKNVQSAVGPAVLRRLSDIDVAQFNYNSDEEFLKNFAAKYKLLKQGAAARFFIRKYMQASGKKAENWPVTTWSAKILVLEKLLEDYEDRMKLISSPYYALFTKSDLSRYLKKDGEQAIGKLGDKGLQEFLRLYRKLNKSGVGQGKDHAKFVQKQIEVHGDRRQSYDMKWVQAELGRKKITNDKEAKDFVRERYDRKKAESHKSFPKDDMEFLKKVKPPVFNLPRDAYDVDSLPQQEQILIKILETGELSDGKQTVKISREHMDELKKQMKTYADQRRKCFAFWNAYKSVTEVTLCESIDYQNPMLKKKHPEVVKAVDLLMNSGREEDKLIHKQDSSAFYFWADGLRSMFLTLHRQGYTLSQKYENRIHDPKFQEETLEDVLINKTNHFSATQKQKEENIKSGKLDKDGNFSFLTYKINGTEFTLFGRNQLQDFLGKKEFKLEGENVPEILEAFKRLTEYDRLHAIVAQEFMNVGGEKGIIEYVYKEEMKDKVVRELLNINRLLKGRIPGFTEALSKNYKDFLKQNGFSLTDTEKEPEKTKEEE